MFGSFAKEAFPGQSGSAGPGKAGEGNVLIDTGAIFFSHTQAHRVHKVAAKKRPCPADIRAGLMYRAELLRIKKYAAPVKAHGNMKFGTALFRVPLQKRVDRHAEKCGKPGLVTLAQYYAAFAPAALAAQAAGKNRRIIRRGTVSAHSVPIRRACSTLLHLSCTTSMPLPSRI